jgi:hypothetical protein
LNNTDEFKGVLAGKRRVDVVVDVSDTKRIFYEFKSTKDVPPYEFAAQFIKDLSIANDLDQIKWIFDGKKVTSLDKTKFLDELRKIDISNDVIKKWTGRDGKLDDMLKLIENEFNNIFIIK